jgi:hypothetical protein
VEIILGKEPPVPIHLNLNVLHVLIKKLQSLLVHTILIVATAIMAMVIVMFLQVTFLTLVLITPFQHRQYLLPGDVRD